MAFLRFNNVGISGMSGAVPANTIDNYKYTDFFPEEAVKEIVDKVGIKQRRFADEKTCSSDLCFAAAERLLSDMQINREEIDLLIFVSQTPDYRMPATSILLQHRLGLGKHTMAFDISLGCSGFVYGLSTVFSFMQTAGLRKLLAPLGRLQIAKSLLSFFSPVDFGLRSEHACSEQTAHRRRYLRSG